MLDTTSTHTRAPRVVVVEDDPGQLRTITDLLADEGFDVAAYPTAREALKRLTPGEAAVAVIDLRLPDMDGRQLLERLRELDPRLRVILHTAFGSFGTAKDAVNLGAFGFVEKLADPEELMRQVHRAVADRATRYAAELQAEVALRTAELRTSEARLGYLLQNLPVGVSFVNADLRYVHLNAIKVELHGLTQSELIGCRVSDVPSALARRIEPFYRAILERDDVPGDVEFDSSDLSLGEPGRHFLARFFPVRGADDRLIGAGSVFVELTDRKRAERGLAELAAIVQSSEGAIVGTTVAGVIRTWNPAAERVFGYPSSRVIGHPIELLSRAEHPSEFGDALAQVARGRRVEPFETSLRRCDDRPIDVAVSVAPIYERATDGLAGIAVIAHDISRMKRLEVQFHQAQKMEAVGRLAGGVAHDFNNLLTIITGYTDLLAEKNTTDDSSRDALGEIRKAGTQAAALTRQLLALSRKQILEPKVLDLNGLVRDNTRMLQRLLGEDVELVFGLAEQLGPIKADPSQLEQVILNLAINARDAMPSGGRLTITTYETDAATVHTASEIGPNPNRSVVLEFTDTGVGIPESIRVEIFEPFFSTKGHHGTGLGLAVVHGVVTQSGGTIEVESQVGIGSTFRVYLPRHHMRTEAPASGVSAPNPLPKGTETILLVEDEPGVRSLAAKILLSRGYTVLEAGSGPEAIALANAYPERIHLLLTDVVMPGMSGRQVAEAIAAARPGMRVLFVSGYTDDAIVRHGITEAEVAFLPKPFNSRSLALKVRDVLDAGSI